MAVRDVVDENGPDVADEIEPALEPDVDAPDRRATLLALGVALVVATLPYWEVLTGRRSAMYGDVNDFAVPEYVSVWRAITHGDWPWWTPGVFGGHSMVGAGQYAVFYPLNAIFGVLEPVTAYRWWLLAHLWIGTAGAFAWSWRRWGSRAGAIVSGVAYSGSGFAVLHLVHPPFVMAVAWLPFVFLGLDLVRERWSAGRAAVLAVPLALIGLCGHPQMLWIALLGAGTYAVVTSVVGRDRAGLLRIGAATAIGIGLSAMQLLPLWSFGQTSDRPSLSMDAAFELSARPRDLLTLVFPWLYGGSTQGSVFSQPWMGGEIHHEVGMFAGAAIVTLALFAIVLRARRRDPAVLALGAVALVAVAIALGGSTPVGRAVYDIVPLARSFRAWARLSLVLGLALACLAGAGVQELRRVSARAVPALGAAVVGLGLVAVALPHASSLRESLAGGSYGLVARGLPVVVLLALLATAALLALHPRIGVVAVVAVCALEVWAFVHPAEWRGFSAPVRDLEAYYDEDVPPTFGATHDAAGGVDRWVSSSYGFRMVSLAKDLRGVNGYDSLIQDEWADTAGGFLYDGFPTRPDFWQPGWLADVLRATTLVAAADIVPTDPTWHRAGDVPEVGMVRWEREPRLPEAYLVGDVRVASLDDIRAALVDPDTPLRRTAYVESGADGVDGAARALDRPGRSGRVLTANVLGDRGNGGTVEVEADRPSLLVLSHTWSDGWTATVDGDGVEVLRTNGLVLGVVVPAGHHVVRLRYLPPGMVPGVAVAALAAYALVGGAPVSAWLLAWFRERRATGGARTAAGPTRSGAGPP